MLRRFGKRLANTGNHFQGAASPAAALATLARQGQAYPFGHAVELAARE